MSTVASGVSARTPPGTHADSASPVERGKLVPYIGVGPRLFLLSTSASADNTVRT